MMVLSTRGSAFEIISEEISFVKEVRPPYGPEEQPVVDATMREINQVFAYRLPQTALFYSLAGASLGLFTVSYFTSFMLLEDQGPKRVVDIGFLISKGVNVYMGRTIPIILALLFLGGWYVMGTAGPRAVACFAVGAALNLLSAGGPVRGAGPVVLYDRLLHAF
ncbi:Cyb5d2 [Symbiodinium sp. KB8]|nr:Cyb5d2 [Symbiodinium sp. KB8]